MLLVILLSRYVEFPKMWYFYPTEVERSKFLACRENPPPKHLIPVPSLCGTSWSPHEENPEGGSGFTTVREDRGGGAPPSNNFFRNPPHQNRCSPWGTPHLKMNSPIWKTTALPLKHEAPFHEMIPRKSAINNNLKSS